MVTVVCRKCLTQVEYDDTVQDKLIGDEYYHFCEECQD